MMHRGLLRRALGPMREDGEPADLAIGGYVHGDEPLGVATKWLVEAQAVGALRVGEGHDEPFWYALERQGRRPSWRLEIFVGHGDAPTEAAGLPRPAVVIATRRCKPSAATQQTKEQMASFRV